MRLNIFTIVLLFITSFSAMAIEEPEFISIEKKDAFEIREYQPKLIAQVLVNGTFDSASSKGFRLLADFIFGNNKTNEGSKKIDMTAPVISRDATEKIDMTAPVVSEETEKGWYVSFNMPKQYTKETLPVPINPEVKIIEVPSEKYAVITFSGLVREKKYAEMLNLLNEEMKKRNIDPKGPAILARYNPPWTLPFLRRNELMFRI
ncbi:SOUL family heme-binding protein [Candidatus Methylopumilus universalis]|jgi:effector-binding domain-containing protein|uniref:SOUL family heme-binding protein n=1 Tax=Candidatus Methylopumilus universalis TaxID=2588536 RepID=UPI001CB9D367|nr:heme-binding protein [Candidatus Methylopumilus universalis]